ncbi:hypothetical protein HJ588_18140 [Flexivirga sp. ID2601S]|uniref:YfhO family protein n=1 Tax=Flexivirga aerilata TaxID=1656889 RepID=A0A849AK26_9MICO|nr:hypothetical protein [Flexivirga aerilata]NNG41184.1 hypothetical protein [Flexivirga aerilata]
MTAPDRAGARLGQRTIGGLVGLACGLLALGPGLRPGYLLFYDLVFVPRLPLGDRTLGVDGSVPRAVPNDFVVALLSHLMPGWVVEKLVLLVVFAGVGAGVGALSRTRLGAAAAALAAAWNPYVAERLAIGHWGYLLGYSCLPFLVAAAAACREGSPRAPVRLGVWLLLSAATGSTGAVLGLIAVLCTLAVPGDTQPVRRRLADLGWALLVFLLANATWWYAYLVLAPSQESSRAGVEAFMSRPDTPWGVIGSLLTGGGIWNSGVWFAGRESPVTSGLALLVVLLCLALAVRDRVWRLSPALAGLGVAGLVGLLLAAATAVPGLREVMTAVVTDVPGGGLLRDAQKFVGLWMVFVAVLAGRLAERVRDAGARVGSGRATALGVAAIVALWPVITLTGPAWGAGGTWRAVSYPASYSSMQERIDRLPPGGVAVFPWNLYRRYAFDHDVVVLDPWQRLLDRRVLVNDSLPLAGGRDVPGEDPDAAAVGRALAGAGDPLAVLRSAGVRYVLVQTDQPTTAGMPDLTGTRVLARDGTLRLHDLGPVATPDRHSRGPERYLGWLLAAAAVVLVAGRAILGTVSRSDVRGLTRG